MCVCSISQSPPSHRAAPRRQKAEKCRGSEGGERLETAETAETAEWQRMERWWRRPDTSKKAETASHSCEIPNGAPAMTTVPGPITTSEPITADGCTWANKPRSTHATQPRTTQLFRYKCMAICQVTATWRMYLACAGYAGIGLFHDV